MRSDLVVHWTGASDISPGVRTLADLAALSGAQQTAYVQRLTSILTQGFWMTRPLEQIRGAGASYVGYRAPMVCFIEVRLSQVFEHARHFGLLGVAVERRFVLQRFGGPVQYVRNHPDERIIARATDVGGWLQNPATGTQQLFDAFSYLVSFLKAMSSQDSDDFRHLDEHEWRLVYTPEQEAAGTIEKPAAPPPEYRVRLQPQDIKLVVFPNEGTRHEAAADPAVSRYFQPLGRPPVFLTIEECLPF